MIGCAFMLSTAMTISAQQLPNYGFESWKSSCGSTEAFGKGGSSNSPKTGEMRQRPGVEPTEWNGSSVNQKVSLEKKQELVFNETADVASGSSSVKMQNIYVGVSIMGMKIGSTAPGFLTLGTPWVYAESSVKNCDGGVYGGISFVSKPDAITGKYKRTDSNEENSYIIAYLWNGTFTSNVGKKNAADQSRNDEVRAILGKVTPTTAGNLVAKCEYTFKSTGGEWQEITVPLEYVEGAGEPTKMNIVVSGGDFYDRDALVENTTLLADDIKFLYYSRLNDLQVAGVSVDGFASDVYNYTMAGTELPSESDITVSHMGVGASHSVAIDAVNATVSIAVTNAGEDVDGQSIHTYVLQYEKAPVKEGVTTEYNGYLCIEMPDLAEEPLAKDKDAVVYVTKYDDGSCDFLLPNFDLGGDMGNIGDIRVEGVTVTVGADDTETYEGKVDGMLLMDGILEVDVKLNGTITAGGVVDMKIDVDWDGIPIYCTFKSTMSGIDSIIAPELNENAPVEYYNLQGVKVANPENGVYIRVQGSKATKVYVK